MPESKRGNRNDDFTLSVDLAPTITNEHRIPSSQALVRRDWKYFYWPDHDYEQLFHLETDPLEENDLARDPAHAEKLAEMSTRFHQLRNLAR